MISMIKEWIRKVRDYDRIVERFSEIDKLLQESIEIVRIQKEEIKDFKKTKNISVNDADYWNNKWVKKNVYYKAPIKKKVIEYLKDGSNTRIEAIANSIIHDFSLNSDNVDSTPLAVMKWLEKEFKNKNFVYKHDKKETWSSPAELLKTKKGDCDDYGILLYNIIRQISKKLNLWSSVCHRLKCSAGNVNRYSTIPSSVGGHFYLLWLHSDGKWYTIETTYFGSKAILHFREKPQKLNTAYGTIWFTFNESYSWAQNSLTVTKDDFIKN